jgi:hypothetical protein
MDIRSILAHSVSWPTIEFTYVPNGQRENMRNVTGTTVYS